MGGYEYMSLILVQAASTESIRSGGGGWCRSRDKDRYSDRYRMSGVRWYSTVGVACLPQYGCQPIRDGVARATRADHPERDLVVVGNVLLGPVSWSLMVICPRFPKES